LRAADDLGVAKQQTKYEKDRVALAEAVFFKESITNEKKKAI